MKSYKDLLVWQKSIELCTQIYKVSSKWPKNELYGLTSQVRKCCVSIPSNIAEGSRRGSKQEYIHFLRIAFGSGAELETQLLIALKIDYLKEADYDKLIKDLEEVMKMLNKLINVLSQSTHYKLEPTN